MTTAALAAQRAESSYRARVLTACAAMHAVNDGIYFGLYPVLPLMAADLGLGGCAIGSVNIDLFARMTGLDFHVEGPVGQFALGRPAAET